MNFLGFLQSLLGGIGTAASAGIVSAHSSASTANSDQIRFIIRLLNAKMQFLCEIFIKTIYHPCADGKSFYKKHKK